MSVSAGSRSTCFHTGRRNRETKDTAVLDAFHGYGKTLSASERSAGGKVNPRFLAGVLLRVR